MNRTQNPSPQPRLESDPAGAEVPGEPERVCYRYRTATLVGRWRRTPDKALDDAVQIGLARRDRGAVEWRVIGGIEESRCDEPGPCGGTLPPPD